MRRPSFPQPVSTLAAGSPTRVSRPGARRSSLSCPRPGTRGALLAPLPPPTTLVLLEEHDPAHKPPGPPRLHSRDILMRRAAVDGSRLILLSGAPSVESWARVDEGAVRSLPDGGGAWPQIIAADTRGILRNHPLTLPLTRAIEEMSRRGRGVSLIVGRATCVLCCNDCYALLDR